MGAKNDQEPKPVYAYGPPEYRPQEGRTVPSWVCLLSEMPPAQNRRCVAEVAQGATEDRGADRWTDKVRKDDNP